MMETQTKDHAVNTTKSIGDTQEPEKLSTRMQIFARITKLPTTRWLFPLIIVLALLLRFVGQEKRWLWYDELLTVNFSAHGPWAALVSSLRFDVHPPFYYVQLSLWSLASDSDAWLMTNTVLWSTAAVGVLAVCATRAYGTAHGLLAALLLAVAPAALAYSDQVRMYSMLMVVAIWAWFAQFIWLRRNEDKLTNLAFIASQLILIYSHSAGFAMLSGPVLFGAASVLLTRNRQLIVKWFGLQSLVAGLALPAVALAALRTVEHTRSPGIAEITQTWTFLTTGAPGSNGLAVMLAALFAVGLLTSAVFRKDLRLPLATLVIAPLLIVAVISHAIKPMWLDRVFLPTVPFLCLILALTVLPPQGGPRKITSGRILAAVLTVTIWSGLGISQQLTRSKGDGFKPAAELMLEKARPNDLILVDDDFNYWSFLWYYAGPEWGRPQHAFLLRQKWINLMNRLPQNAPMWLDFNSTDVTIERHDIKVALWDRSESHYDNAPNVFVVRLSNALPYTLSKYRLQESFKVRQLIIDEWRRE